MSLRDQSRRRGGLRLAAAVVALFSFMGGTMVAQETTGTITGTVTDPSGAAIPGATIEITGPNLPRPLVASSDEGGSYLLGNVPVGTYAASATANGFTKLRKNDLNVVIGRTLRLNFAMEVGSVSESVVVSADAVMVDTTSSSSAVTVDKSFSDLLPKGRSFYDLAMVAPGARPESKTGGVQVDGASGSENTFYIDGMEVTDIRTGVLAEGNRIPVEMIQQMQIKNGVTEAQYGGAMGGVISAVVRSGTNAFHGQAGFYFNNDSMEGRPRDTLRRSPFDDVTPEQFRNPKDSFTNWNPVFTLGGPIMRDKLFFFTGYSPVIENRDRNVGYNRSGDTVAYNVKSRHHYLANKLDYMPVSKLRLAGSWVWNPSYARGVLPSRLGDSDQTNDWTRQGKYDAGQIFAYSADYMPTSKMVISFRGGYHFNNHNTNYGIPNKTSIYYSGNVTDPQIPADLRAPAGYISFAPGATFFDAYKRHNYNADVSYLANWFGQHNLKGGWQMNRLSNTVNEQTWAAGYYRYFFFNTWTCITSQCDGRQTGTYGYMRYREISTIGDVSSNNQALFFQDTWRVNKHLTLNLGIRTEREYVPSFATGSNIPSRAITFPWSQKFSPRLGFSWDPKGDGSQRIYVSWGQFYDIMKYELPRGSFGGDRWLDYMYTLDDPQAIRLNQGIPADPKKLQGGKFLEVVNWRVPANDPEHNTIDPNLKPMKQRMFDIGYERSLSSTLVASARYTNRRLIRTIEDVGTLGPDGEVYYIANPGYGIVADPKTWDPGIPATPKAKRNYDAVEFRLDKRFSRTYQFAATYTWSRQYGNYSGLASSDEPNADGVGRTSPNANRYFDLPWVYYTERGQFAEGRLATDRPHTFKFFGGYTTNSKFGSTTLSPNIMLYSGTPLTTEADAISTVPTAPYGRGDLGRTPVFLNTDFNVVHKFRPFGGSESKYVQFEFTVFNLLNTNTITNRNTTLLYENDGVLDFPSEAAVFKGFNTRKLMAEQGIPVNTIYNWSSGRQAPRSARIQLSFFF